MSLAALLLLAAPMTGAADPAPIIIVPIAQPAPVSRDRQIAEVEAVLEQGGSAMARRLQALTNGGNSYAGWQLGVFVDTGQHGIAVDVDRAFALFSAAAAAGEPNAHSSLGLMHASGRGTVVDYVASRLAYAQAAALGVAHGYYGIGVLYALGQGVDRDYEQALVYFLVAAALEDQEAFGPVRELMRATPDAALPSIVERANALLSAAGRSETIIMEEDRLSFRRGRPEASAPGTPVD